MQRPWSMYNKVEKLRVDDLKPEHVKLILLAIPNAKMNEWYACQEGDLHWQPISSIPEFYEDVRQLKGTALTDDQAQAIGKVQPPTPKADADAEDAPKKQNARRPLFEDAPEDAMMTDPALMVDTSRTSERRSARRYQRKLMFRVIQGGKSFQTETEDVSMAGVSLNDQLPPWVPKTFRAELALNKTNVRVLCERVDDNKLKLKDADSWDVIRQWLVNW